MGILQEVWAEMHATRDVISDYVQRTAKLEQCQQTMKPALTGCQTMLSSVNDRLIVIEERLKTVKTSRTWWDWVRDIGGLAMIAAVGATFLVGLGRYQQQMADVRSDVAKITENINGIDCDLNQISIDVAKMGVALDRAPAVRSYVPQDVNSESVKGRTAKFKMGRMAAPKLK